MRHIICAATLTLLRCGPEGNFTQETNQLPTPTAAALEQSADAVGTRPLSTSTSYAAEASLPSNVENDAPVKTTTALNSIEPLTTTTGPSSITPTTAPAPAPTPLACSSTTTIIGATQSTELTWSGTGPATFKLITLSLTPPVNLGSIKVSTDGNLQVSYTAPISAPLAFDVQVVARSSSGSEAACEVKIKADGDLGVADDGSTQGIVGSVYEIPYASRVNSAKLTSSWFSGTPLATILMPRLDVPNTPYENGFPGYPNLTAWYAIRFTSRLVVPVSGSYTFQTKSDDGSNLYIDGKLVVANDHVQAITTATSATVQLSAGIHTLQMDYFQGPPIYIAMMMLWRIPGTGTFTVIPSTNLLRPLQQ